MAIRVTDAPSQPRARWVWVIALSPVLPALNWFAARSDRIGLNSLTADWLPVSGPALDGRLAFALTFLLLGLLPAIACTALLGWSPRRLGLGAGSLRAGAVLLAIGVPIAILAGYVGSGDAALRAVYPLGRVHLTLGSLAPHGLLYFAYYLGFEFYFRGALMLGLEDRLGPRAANVFQAALATMAHLGKPGMELLAAFPASLAFGWAVLRCRSIWPVTLIHWSVGIALDLFILAR